MRIYHRSPADIAGTVKRSFADAESGRTKMGLVRLTDLLDEFRNEPNVIYAQGLMYRDFLGQGVKASDLFEQAHRKSTPGTEVHALSACNAALYSRDADEFRYRVERAFQIAPHDEAVVRMRADLVGALNAGTPWWSLMIDMAEQHRQARSPGPAAVALELALKTCTGTPAELANAHRMRAQCLRELDYVAERHRRTLGEAFAPTERLTLHTAVEEIDLALSHDEWDAELWNLKSAWCALLERHDDALACAAKAIELRPSGYAKPHQNRALALKGLGRKTEAADAARAAIAAAQAAGAADDEALARDFLTTLDRPAPGPAEMSAIIERVLRSAKITAQQEADPVPSLRERGAAPIAARIRQMAMMAARGTSLGYVPIIAELLTDMGPELAFEAVSSLATSAPAVHQHCVNAAVYVAAKSESIRRRDAARLVALHVMSAGDFDACRREYRRLILEPAAAGTGDLEVLNSTIGDEIGRINEELRKQLSAQPPIDDPGRARGKKIIDLLTGEIPPPRPPVGAAVGCLLVLAAAIATAVWFFFFRNKS